MLNKLDILHLTSLPIISDNTKDWLHSVFGRQDLDISEDTLGASLVLCELWLLHLSGADSKLREAVTHGIQFALLLKEDE